MARTSFLCLSASTETSAAREPVCVADGASLGKCSINSIISSATNAWWWIEPLTDVWRDAVWADMIIPMLQPDGPHEISESRWETCRSTTAEALCAEPVTGGSPVPAQRNRSTDRVRKQLEQSACHD